MISQAAKEMKERNAAKKKEEEEEQQTPFSFGFDKFPNKNLKPKKAFLLGSPGGTEEGEDKEDEK